MKKQTVRELFNQFWTLPDDNGLIEIFLNGERMKAEAKAMRAAQAKARATKSRPKKSKSTDDDFVPPTDTLPSGPCL